MSEAFALWITGLPASGKTTLALAVARRLEAGAKIRVAHLESDGLRKLLTPEPTFTEKERDWFYRILVYTGRLLVSHGVSVVFDATANRRTYRDAARASIPRFLEIYVRCPVEICKERDPKGIYRKAEVVPGGTVPGVQAAYEEPLHPDLIIDTSKTPANAAAEMIVSELKLREWV